MSQQYTQDPFLDLSDRITVKQVDGSLVREKDITLSTLIQRLSNKGESTQLVRIDSVYDLTALGAALLSISLPANIVPRYMAFKIVTTPTYDNSGMPSVAAAQIGLAISTLKLLMNGAKQAMCLSAFAASPDLHIQAYNLAGAAADGLIITGSVRVVFEYELANELE